MSARDVAREIARGGLSSREAVEAHVRRIETVNPVLNAVVVPLFERALAEAAEADEAQSRGRSRGVLHGVPMTIKESFDVEGTPTTVGLTKHAAHRASADAPTVARLRAAGAIILGKTNVPQLVMLNETDNPVYGRTNNPFDHERGTGGSSGGCGATVSARGSTMSLGSDIGGSVRLPAHACGVHSIKPTSGRLTMQGHAPVFAGQEAILAQPGVLARSVADLALALEVLSAPGQEAFDVSIAPVAPVASDTDVDLARLRVAYYTDNGILRPSPAVRRAVEEAARALAERGAEVEEWTPPSASEAWEIYQGLLFADRMAGAKRALRGSKRDWRINRITRILALPRSMYRLAAWEFGLFGQPHLSEGARRLGRSTADDYWQLTERRARFRSRFVEELDARRFDAIICPPDALPALKHGSSFYLSDAMSYPALYNLVGMPAGVVAATRVRAGEESDRVTGINWVERAARRVEDGSAGLPVGVQVIARHWREEVLLALMSALEEHFRAQGDCPLNDDPSKRADAGRKR